MNAQNQSPAPADASQAPAAGPARSPVVAAILAWLVFGLGHLYLGRYWKAWIFFVFLSVTFIAGVVLSSCVFFPQETQAYSYWIGVLGSIGYVWSGLYYLAVLAVLGPGGELRSITYEVGWVAALSAALLNLLVMLDAYDIALRKKD